MAVSDPLFLDKSNPELWRSIVAFSEQLGESYRMAGIDARLAELVNLRVSQINGCSYCLDLHTRRALEAGESMQRIALLGVWEDADLFDERERAALVIAEAATELPCHDERVAALASARMVLSDEEFSVIQWLAISMNAFNRISILSRHPVRPREFKVQAKK